MGAVQKGKYFPFAEIYPNLVIFSLLAVLTEPIFSLSLSAYAVLRALADFSVS
jgi:hypothetical protein